MDLRFQSGETVVLVAASLDDPAREKGWWNPLMDKFVGQKGIIVSVDADASAHIHELVYGVRFNEMTDEDGDAVRSMWFCKDEWLCYADEKEIDSSSIDNFFSEF